MKPAHPGEVLEFACHTEMNSRFSCRPIMTDIWSTSMSRTLVMVLLVVVSSPLAWSKDKPKVLPANVLHAQTILVVIDPDAAEPVTNPNANAIARQDVEKALMEWGRFRLAIDAQTADLVLSVRKGTARTTPTVAGGPIDNRPVILQPDGQGDIRIGAQQGRPPAVTQAPTVDRPRVGTQVGSSDDTVELYVGGVDYPLDGTPIWRYTSKDALQPPKVPAIDQLRKAISETEKALQQKQKP